VTFFTVARSTTCVVPGLICAGSGSETKLTIWTLSREGGTSGIRGLYSVGPFGAGVGVGETNLSGTLSVIFPGVGT
jgi:hypothetical protein